MSKAKSAARIKQRDCLRAYWSETERDMMYYFPLGIQTKCDAGFLCSVLNKEFKAEMTRRGYDIKTMRFSIHPAKGNDRFASQRPESA